MWSIWMVCLSCKVWDSKIWTSKLKDGGFMNSSGFLWVKGFWVLVSLSLFFGLFLLQMLPLFIGKRFGNKSWLGLQEIMLWFGWNANIKLCQFFHGLKMKYQSCWYKGATSHDLWWSIISNKQGMSLRQNLYQKACFSRITMVPLCHKWKDLLVNGLNTWVMAQEWV